MKIKKFTALVLTMAVGASIFAGCSKSYSSVITIDNEGVAPGMYLMAQLEAYTKASQEVEDGTEVLKATIDEKPAQEWIKEETLKILKTNAFYNKEFERRGLELTEQEISQIEASTTNIWPNLEKIYKDNGINLTTYTEMFTTMYKRDKIFFDIYGEGKEKAPTAEEYAKYIDENYARIRGFQISKQDVAGANVAEEAIKQLSDIAIDAQKELDGGADFNDVRIKYMRIAGTVVGLTTGFDSEEEYSVKQFIKKDIAQFPETLVNEVFAAEVDGKFYIQDLETSFLVYQRVANDEDPIQLASLQASVVSEMKNDEFTAFVDESTAKYEVSEDAAAVSYYAATKIK